MAYVATVICACSIYFGVVDRNRVGYWLVLKCTVGTGMDGHPPRRVILSDRVGVYLPQYYQYKPVLRAVFSVPKAVQRSTDSTECGTDMQFGQYHQYLSHKSSVPTLI